MVGGGAARVNGQATILTSTDPTGGPSSWSSAPVASSQAIVDAVSCPSVSLCVVSDSNSSGNGNILTTTPPTASAGAWTKATIDPGKPSQPVGLDALSCPWVALCVASDGNGNILTSTDPTGGASAWTKASVEQLNPNGNSLNPISCPSVSLCIAADSNGNILTSTAPTGGANAWRSATVDIPGCAPPSIPCVSEQLYARDDQGTRILDSAPSGHGTSIGTVALGGDSLRLSWTHNGDQRQLQLR